MQGIDVLQQYSQIGQDMADAASGTPGDGSYTALQTVINDTSNQLSQQSVQQQSQYVQSDAAAKVQYAQNLQNNLDQRAINTRNMASAQIANLGQFQVFQNQLTDYNVSVLTTNATQIRQSALNDQFMYNNIAAQRSGQVQAGYAAGNVMVNTGSAADVNRQTLTQTFQQADQDYASKINGMEQVMGQITQAKAQNFLAQANTTNQQAMLGMNVNMQLSSQLPPMDYATNT